MILILNGSVQRIPVFSKEEIYQMVEPRFILVLEGSAEVCINLQDYHIEKGNVMLSPADTIVEVNKISDDARVTVIVFRDSIEMSDEVVYKTSPAEFDRLLRMYYIFMGCRTPCPLSPKNRTVFCLKRLLQMCKN